MSGGTAVNGNTDAMKAVGSGTALSGNPGGGVKNAVGGGSGIADTAQNDSGGGTADNVNAGMKKAVAIGGGSGIADNVNNERPLGRRDNITDTDNGFTYQPREVRRLRKQQTHTAVVGTRAANGRFRGAQAPS